MTSPVRATAAQASSFPQSGFRNWGPEPAPALGLDLSIWAPVPPKAEYGNPAESIHIRRSEVVPPFGGFSPKRRQIDVMQ